jgi:hypothetical protein
MSEQGTDIWQKFELPASEDLTGKEHRLVKHCATGCFRLPDSLNDIPVAVLVAGAAQGQMAQAVPLSPSRVPVGLAKGQVTRGQKLVMADPANAEDRGKLMAMPLTPGSYRLYGICAQDANDGEPFRFFPVSVFETVQ